MESNTGGGQGFDVGSLYAHFCELHDSRKAKGKRYAQWHSGVGGLARKVDCQYSGGETEEHAQPQHLSLYSGGCA